MGEWVWFWKEYAYVTKRPPLLIYCVAFSEEKQGASKCRNVIQGTIRRHSLCLKDKHLAPLPFRSTYLQIHFWKKRPCARWHRCSFCCKNALKCTTHPSVHYNTLRILYPAQFPSQTRGAYVDVCCTQIKQMWATFRTEPSVPTQLQLASFG